MSEERPSPDSVFPHSSYRSYQRAALYEASHALYEQDGVDNVVLNLPTGIGKSAINTALARQARDAFITTPQKALRTQLEEDNDLRGHYTVLRARSDYPCPVGLNYGYRGSYTCKDCPVNQDEDLSCLQQDNCPYWQKKITAMNDSIAVITFSYLIVDGYLPVIAEGGDSDGSGSKQVSFGDRELLVVDECHKLEDQVASLHAGIVISPHSLPMEVFGGVDRAVGELPDDTITEFDDVKLELDRLYDRAESYINTHKARSSVVGEEDSQDVRNCRSFVRKYEWCKEKVRAGRVWVVSQEETVIGGEVRYSINLRPVDVDDFLAEHVWSRGDKRVLSTATMPFSDTPERWAERLGLDPERTHVVQYPMPFPAENRPISTEYVVGKMSQGGYDRHVDQVIQKIRELARIHDGEKGLVHTASYSRAEDLHRAFPSKSVCHDRTLDDDLSLQIERWQNTDRDIFFSPASTDGVDLPADQCRWQVLVKVPYPNSRSDARVRYLLNERKDWNWYYEVTCQSVQQSVGRGVRSPADECTYYVLDASFFDVIDNASVPSWFREAIQR